MPVIRASLLAVLALISCALALDLARAQDPTTETGTTLHPGLNLIGWTAEPTPTSQLFREIPQLEAVWAWDAELDDWIVAARGAPEWLGGLGRLTPGMGLRMQLSGNEPYHWQRSTEPTRGLVKLRTGWNLVAWSGADQTPIDDALKGIGWSLRNVHRWNPTNQQWSTWTSPTRTTQLIAADNTDQETNGDSEMPTIRRGEALWINVARAVNWLQPTDLLPRLVFPGGASQQLQARVREDLEAVLNFFRTQYGIQAEPDFTIYVSKDVDSLIQAYRDGEKINDAGAASFRVLWNLAAGWAGTDVVVKQSFWLDDLSTDDIAWARYTITHEYFHILQNQLSDGWASQWLVEGTASWIDDQHKVLDGEQAWSDLRDGRLSAITNDTPTLRSTESENAQWEYTLGWLATDHLAANTTPDFPIEFWRQLAPTKIGPHGRWSSTLDWRTVFHQTFGQPMSEFYAGFDDWQREQATANPTAASSYDGNWILGRVTDAGGEPVVGLFVNAIRVEGETSVGWNQRAETAADGTFAVRAPEDGDYRLSININDDCIRYYSDGQLISDGRPWDDQEEARLVKVSQSDVTGIDIQLSPNACGGWQIRGRIVGPNTEPLVGIPVAACLTDLLHCDLGTHSADGQVYLFIDGGYLPGAVATTDVDGQFAFTVSESGEYRIIASLGDNCSMYFRSGAPTVNRRSASPITVDDAPTSGILMRVPEGMCAYRISGWLVDASGAPLAESWIEVSDPGGGVRTDPDGRFEIRVPSNGAYTFDVEILQPYCNYNFEGQTPGSPNNPIRVSGADVTNITLRLPDTIEELCK